MREQKFRTEFAKAMRELDKALADLDHSRLVLDQENSNEALVHHVHVISLYLMAETDALGAFIGDLLNRLESIEDRLGIPRPTTSPSSGIPRPRRNRRSARPKRS